MFMKNKRIVIGVIVILVLCVSGREILNGHPGLQYRLIRTIHYARVQLSVYGESYRGRGYIATGDSVINCLGDSITQGDRNDDVSWVDCLIPLTEANKVNKYGIGGSTVSTYVDQHPMCVRYADMAEDANYIIIFAGNNDFTQSVPLGTEDSLDTNTFYGALNIMLSGLREKYPNGKFLYITPLRMWNYEHPKWSELVQYDAINMQELTLNDYRNAIINRCEYYSIPYFDLYNQGLYGRTEKTRNAVYVDGLHPNDEGHKIIASEIAEALKRL